MNYNDLSDMTRRVLRGETIKEGNSKILSILESISVPDVESRRKLNILKKLVRDLERKNHDLLEDNNKLLNSLNSEKGD